MSSAELDPLVRKAIKLLHSRSKDSTAQLRALMEDCMRQRQERISSVNKSGGASSHTKDGFLASRDSPIPRSHQGNQLSMKHDGKRELLNKSRDEDMHVSKRPRIDSSLNVLHSLAPSTQTIVSKSSSPVKATEEPEADGDMNELAIEIGITCVVCKSFEVIAGNQLIECSDCHTLYHQECHKPPVSHQDVTDPRVVWYCAKCTRNLKKQNALATTASASSLGSRSAPSQSKSSSQSSSSSKIHSGTSKTSGLQRPTPFTNLASAQRNLGGTTTTLSSSSSNTSSSSSSGNGKSSSGSTLSRTSSNSSSNLMMSAERRVHLMKKKAAAKNAERRKI